MESWFGSAYLVLSAVAFGAGYVGGILRSWVLHRRVYSLECAVADLENKVLVEVKRRAGQERQKGSKIEAEILEAASKKTEEPKPWWWSQGRSAGN